MADMMKTQNDKMALIFLIVDVFESLNMQIDVFLSSESAGVFLFSFECIVKELSATKKKGAL